MSPRWRRGWPVSARRTRRAGDPDAWLEGHGWDVDRWGRWPTADDLETVAPGRRAALWAHDHHALLASRAALTTAGVDRATADPSGGVIRRDGEGAPEGVLYEAATRLVTRHVPPITGADLEGRIVAVSLALLALGVVAAHDPGPLSPDPDLDWSYPAYARLSELERLPVRVLASLRDDALETALAGGLRSGAILGANPRGRARIGWQKCFADGSLGSRTAALLADIEPEPDRPLAPERRRGVWITEPGELRERVERAAAGGIATQIHGIGDAAVRAALDALEPTAATVPFMPKVEHVQLLDPADVGRFAAAGIVASVQPSHLGSDAQQARRLWGDRAERSGYAWATIAATGAVLAFGTDAPVEPFDPWPGIALAVRREDAALAGRHAGVRARRGAEHRRRPAGRLCRAAAFRSRARSGAPDRRSARRHRGHPGRVAGRAGRARRRPLDHAPDDGPRRRAGRVRGLAGQPVSPDSCRFRPPRPRRRASGVRRRTAR